MYAHTHTHTIYMHQPTHMKNGEKILIYEIDAID